MKIVQCLMTCYFLTCSYIYGTSVIQEKKSCCYNYGKCYNHVWCDNVLSSRNCSEKHLVKKLECLSALLADPSNDSQSDMIYSLTNNVTMMMKQVHDLNEEMVVIKSTCSDTRTDFIVIKAETEREMKENYENVKQKLTDNKGKTFQKMTSKIYADIEELLERLDKSAKSHENELISETGKFQVNIDDCMKKIITELEALKAKVKTSLEMSLQETKHNIEGLRTKIKTLIITEIETLSKQIFEMNQSVLQQQKFVEVISRNIFNKENFMMAFMILTAIVCFLAVAVFNIYQRLKDTTPVGPNGPIPANQPRKNMGANEILRRLPRNPNLEPGICVISYDENRRADHRKLLDSVNIPRCNVISHVIRRHQQILDLPRCKVYLMCTEFSERHVIIEEPGLGLGDLHRTTYGAVMKLGGSLIILYTKDPGSKHLKNDALYNTNIYCVTKQPELSDLEKNGCFVSTYDVLTDYQKTELRKKIVENINLDNMSVINMY